MGGLGYGLAEKGGLKKKSKGTSSTTLGRGSQLGKGTEERIGQRLSRTGRFKEKKVRNIKSRGTYYHVSLHRAMDLG